MATTIVIPGAADIGATSTEVQTAAAADGDFVPRIAHHLIAVSTAATADINALQTGSSVTGINGATVPAGGALTTGNVLQVSGAAALSYGPVNVAGGSNYVTGVLPVANVALRAGIVHSVRGVVTSDVASLSAFTVAGHDGLTFVEGDYVLLAKQSTPAQDGPHVVGVVGGGTAPLTRAADWAAAMVLPANSMVVVAEGTVFKNSRWFTSVVGAVTVGTTAPAFYPERVKGTTVAMTAGAVSVATTWILSASTSVVMLTAKTPGGTAGVLSYGTLTAGAGTGAFDIASSEASDTATVSYVIENWPMSVVQEIVCPSCERAVEPVKRKLPSIVVQAENGSTTYSAPVVGFGYFCPSDDCKARLDRAIEARQNEPKNEFLPENESEDAPVVPIKPATKKVVPIRPPAKESEDLFARIRREHDEVVREERELSARLVSIAERRKTLDLLITAMNVAQEPIAAE
jgi:hypothetical protein